MEILGDVCPSSEVLREASDVVLFGEPDVIMGGMQSPTGYAWSLAGGSAVISTGSGRGVAGPRSLKYRSFS